MAITTNTIFANSTAPFVKTNRAIRKFTMGADPEFVIKNGVSVVASNKTVVEGTDIFGPDGNGVTFEVRPEPSMCPIVITNRIRDCFTRQCLMNPKFYSWDWYAGSWQHEYPIGGHIHFGIKADVIDRTEAAKILSQYLGPISMLIEDVEQGKKRRFDHHQYGRMEDNREQPHGFEYRTMASWLVSPHVTVAFLALGKVVMHEILNNDKFKPSKRIVPAHYTEMNVSKVRELFPDIWNEIITMELYLEYKQQIDLLYLLVMKKVNGQHLTWFPRCSMKEAWGVVDTSGARMSKIRIEAIWKEFSKKNELKPVFR